MTRWRIDVGSTHTLLTEVLDAAADAATPISRGEQALHDAASALAGVDGVGSAMSGLAEEWDGHGARIASLVHAGVSAVGANLVTYIDADETMASSTGSADTASAPAALPAPPLPGRGFGPLGSTGPQRSLR